MRHLVYIFLFIIFLTSQSIVHSKEHSVAFDLGYQFIPEGATSHLEFITILPRTIANCQHINTINFSIPPDSIYENDGNNYAKFVFSNVSQNISLTINVEAMLMNYDLNTALSISLNSIDETFNKYLQSEIFQEKDDPLIQTIAKTITGNEDITIVKNIYTYVKRSMRYMGYTPFSLGAKYAAKMKQGDCTEFSDLFVALCRAKNIPAKSIDGYTTTYYNVPSHAWTEVFLSGYGWVPFDVTLDDNKLSTFTRLKPIYIYFSQTRNDRELTLKNRIQDAHFFSYWYIGSPVRFFNSFIVRKYI
ncbi:MAG TPA: hypothetical protein DF296_12585 [Candidatus Margulisbacteria bacterium]|nr:MAG: hypothetical protein A2X42_01595 [Candidatus Margulisbacteria bacterium GWF2_38_17]OGI10516.1 MAG: hypothetical protein A2X41_07095 [Candidatus Margulisbacteria bacterium GWE2_39_32]HCT86020.1 hypothetical protein [Candidatus Margulisiibacteriota bacterium]